MKTTGMHDPADDEVWLAALRGAPQAGTDPSTLAEAQGVRRAIRESRADLASGDATDDAEAQRLMFRLRREGLLQGSSPAEWWKIPSAAAAALFLGIVVSFTLLQRGGEEHPEETPLRGGAPVQVVETNDVAATTGDIERALRSVDSIVVIRAIDGGGTEIAATVPVHRVSELRKPLSELGLELPQADGSLRVEVRLR